MSNYWNNITNKNDSGRNKITIKEIEIEVDLPTRIILRSYNFIGLYEPRNTCFWFLSVLFQSTERGDTTQLIYETSINLQPKPNKMTWKRTITANLFSEHRWKISEENLSQLNTITWTSNHDMGLSQDCKLTLSWEDQIMWLHYQIKCGNNHFLEKVVRQNSWFKTFYQQKELPFKQKYLWRTNSKRHR